MISIVVISKDEPALDVTLTGVRAQAEELGRPYELIVVDASEGRLDHIRQAHLQVTWIDFQKPAGVGVSIPHQRNHGVRSATGDVIVFTDSGCVPRPGWLATLVDPIESGREDAVAGPAPAPDAADSTYEMSNPEAFERAGYLPESATINLAFRRAVFDAVGGFDERFEYGSDVDFTWRLNDAGYRIKAEAGAVVEHDWGDARRQIKRSYRYGVGRARLYRKHRGRLRTIWRRDPIVVAYPLFLLGLPLTVRYPVYPLLLAVPAWRNRREGVVRTLADHLVYGAGVLSEVARR